MYSITCIGRIAFVYVCVCICVCYVYVLLACVLGCVYWLLVVVVEHQGSGGSTRARVSGAWVLARGPPESVHRVSGTSAGGGEGGECGECEGLRI